MKNRLAIKPLAYALGAIAVTFALSGFAASPVSAAPACPGGGVEKCTPKCTGPVTRPVCTYGPPCTCSMPKSSDKVLGRDRGVSGGNSGGGRPSRADTVGTKGTIGKLGNERSSRDRRDR